MFEDFISHIGKAHDAQPPGRGSGRYAYGSGDNPFQHIGLPVPKNDFIDQINDLKAKGYDTDKKKADKLGMSVAVFRDKRTLATSDLWFARRAFAIQASDKGYSHTSIAKMIGVAGESSVRSLLDDSRAERMKKTKNTSRMLKEMVDKHQFVDVGAGVPQSMGVSPEKLRAAMRALEEEHGYHVEKVDIPQPLNPGRTTTMMFFVGPKTTKQDIYDNRDKLVKVDMHTEDGGLTFTGNKKPVHIDEKRVKIRYAEDGGDLKDGIIEIRKGVPDLSLGKAHYAQVRIAVGEDLYLKGMAVYAQRMPGTHDIVFNTNKSKDVPFNEVLKPMKKTLDGKIDVDNPFGATIKENEKLKLSQRMYTDADGKQKQSAINIVNEEGDWGKWKKRLPSQFLSKQTPELMRTQLELLRTDRASELEDIKKISNNTIRKALLSDFADSCDKDACSLAAKAFPNQTGSVIVPLPTLNPGEVFAPNYANGTKVALIRYPHGGVHEIPIVTVNNNNREGRNVIGTLATDCIGIRKETAQQLSGADFDGDSVTVIPIGPKVKLKHDKLKKELANFEPSEIYPSYEGCKLIKTDQQKEKEMGTNTNLLNDMTVYGAPMEDIIPVCKHTMVVIDAKKHKLNYKQSEIDNRIKQLRKKYQPSGGASTILSRANKEHRIPQRELKRPNEMSPAEVKDWKAGKQIYKNTNKAKLNRKTGEYEPVKQIERGMNLVNDAYELTTTGNRRNPYTVENIYADHANELKKLAIAARKLERSLPNDKVKPSAKAAFTKERESLKKQLREYDINKPLERQATLLANNTIYKKSKEAEYDKEHYKKLKVQSVAGARAKVGKRKISINPTESEWNAILGNAISSTDTQKILRSLGPSGRKELRTRLVPKDRAGLTPGQLAAIRAYLMNPNTPYTQAEIAAEFGVSTSTIQNVRKEMIASA